VDRVKIGIVATELTAGEPVIDAGGSVVLPRMSEWFSPKRNSEGNTVVVSPPLYGHRSLAGDDVPRRRK
jgi:hypothetical protein